MAKKDGLDQTQNRYTFRKTDVLWPLLNEVIAGQDICHPPNPLSGPKPKLKNLAISLTTSGYASLHYENKVAAHVPNSMTLLIPDLAFYEMARSESWKTCWLILDGALARYIMSQVNQVSTAVQIMNIPTNVRLNFLEAVKLLLELPENWQWSWLRAASVVVEHLINALGRKDLAHTVSASACQIMKENLNKNLSIAELAESLTISESTFSHLFKKETGMSPAKMYRLLKIEKSKQLLASGFRVGEVSDLLGFKNQFYFSTLFKKLEALRPREYQKVALTQQLRHHIEL